MSSQPPPGPSAARATWDWPGSRFWRVDLHAHSPASYDFKPESARDAEDWGAWVDAAASAGLHAVAVTDHNSPNGVDALKAAAAARGGLVVVFPGVELTASGVHLLLVLDPSASRDVLVALLAALDVLPSQYADCHASSPKSVPEAMEIAAKAGALVIAAHVNGPKGALTTLERGVRLAVLRSPSLAAVELAEPKAGDDWLDPADDDEVTAWLDGRKTGARPLPAVWGSDSHALHHVGQPFTWVKLSRPDLEGLRLALLDGPASVRPWTAPDPNRHAANVIESLRVSKARHLGRPEPFELRLNPWLNAIIGGRGTGKSTLVDLLRKTLRRDGELEARQGEDALRTAFDRRMQVAGGLLTPETRVEVVYRKDGERFVLSWDPDGQSPAIARLEGDTRVPEAGSVPDRFPVRIYSQKQLFDLATRPDALLGVIDDTDAVRGADLRREREASEARYLSLCAQARASAARAAELPARTAELTDVRRKLAVLESGGRAQVLQQYRARRRLDETWRSVEAAARASLDTVARAARDLVVADLDVAQGASGAAAEQALVRAHAELGAAVDELRATVSNAVAAAAARFDAVQTGSDLEAWRAAVASSEAAFKEAGAALAEAGIASPDVYRDLLARAAKLEAEIGVLQQQDAEARARLAEATAELSRHRSLHDELTARRRAFVANVSGGLVRIEIVAPPPPEDDEQHPLAAYCRDVLGITNGFRDDLADFAGHGLPDAGAAWSYDRLDALVDDVRAFLADPSRLWDVGGKRFAQALRKVAPERVDRLALFVPSDAVAVHFRDPRSLKAPWTPLAKGSPGQQTAALLAFVLGYGTEPIVLDQPEDDLDTKLIYDLVVQRLRETKATRQIVVVTHNPNIVVHGDAELVVALEAQRGRTRIAAEGGLGEAETRRQICEVMEGGREAFEERYRRIMAVSERGAT